MQIQGSMIWDKLNERASSISFTIHSIRGDSKECGCSSQIYRQRTIIGIFPPPWKIHLRLFLILSSEENQETHNRAGEARVTGRPNYAVLSAGRPQQGGWHDGNEQQPQHIVVTSTKSMGLAILLNYPLRPIRHVLRHDLWCFDHDRRQLRRVLVISIFTLGFGALLFFITWPICIIWGALATKSYNEKLIAGQRPL